MVSRRALRGIVGANIGRLPRGQVPRPRARLFKPTSPLTIKIRKPGVPPEGSRELKGFKIRDLFFKR